MNHETSVFGYWITTQLVGPTKRVKFIHSKWICWLIFCWWISSFPTCFKLCSRNMFLKSVNLEFFARNVGRDRFLKQLPAHPNIVNTHSGTPCRATDLPWFFLVGGLPRINKTYLCTRIQYIVFICDIYIYIYMYESLLIFHWLK